MKRQIYLPSVAGIMAENGKGIFVYDAIPVLTKPDMASGIPLQDAVTPEWVERLSEADTQLIEDTFSIIGIDNMLKENKIKAKFQKEPETTFRLDQLNFFDGGLDFSWDNIEVSPVRMDEGNAEVCEEGEEDFWSVYLHRVTGGVTCVADLPSKGLATALAKLISNAALTRVTL